MPGRAFLQPAAAAENSRAPLPAPLPETTFLCRPSPGLPGAKPGATHRVGPGLKTRLQGLLDKKMQVSYVVGEQAGSLLGKKFFQIALKSFAGQKFPGAVGKLRQG